MATLTGNAINTSYQGLIKFDDNGTIDATVLKQLTDGTGGSLPIQVSQVQTKFQSLVDFTGATVTGLPASGNLVNGTGADSLKNVDDLVTNATTAGGAQAIALGNGATSSNAQTIAIGNGALANNFQSVAIGDGAEATGIGAVAMGQYSNANGIYASAWGRTSVASSDGSVAFGQQAEVPSGVAGGVAMGRQVVADLADTTHVRALKIVAPDGGTGGNGITMLSPDGTAGVITLTNASELAVDGTPIGGGGAAGLESGTGADSMQSASSLTTIPAIASGSDSIALGNNATATSTQSIAIGDGADATDVYNIALGKGAQSVNDWTVSIGSDSKAYSRNCVTLGGNAISGILGNSSGGQDAIAIGNQPLADKQRAIAIGLDADALANDAIAIGARADATAQGAIAIGSDTSSSVAPKATAQNAVALGNNVVAATADTVSITLLQIMNYATMNYVNDAAAATGNIPLGGVYHTDGALKIRIV